MAATEDGGSAATFDPSTDITAQLLQRYSSSSATQHRHLLATSAALKSLLLEDSLPLSPFSYFAASLSALSSQNDAVSVSSISTLLSIVLPLIPEGSILPEKAKEAIVILVRVLENDDDENNNKGSSTSTVKCLVKCLGVLVGFCDSGDWNEVRLVFETLLKWSLDKRPKVRKCALTYLENALKSFQSKSVKKKASKLIESLLESHTPLANKLGDLRKIGGPESAKQSEAGQTDVAHVLTVTRVALPYLSDKISVNIILKLIEFLEARVSAFTIIILDAVEAFLENVEVELVTHVADNIINALSSYVSSENSPKESVISATNLLKTAVEKVRTGDTHKWRKSLPPTVKAIAGLLNFEDSVACQASCILKNLIEHQLTVIESQPVPAEVGNDPESNSVASICLVFKNQLGSCVGIPNEHILAVLSALFLKCGGASLFCMRDIVLKLAEIFVHGDAKSDTCQLQKCFGSAVVAMGTENVLSLVPISFSVESLTCSNTWLLPILNKYVFGASLGYFMEHIVPIADSLQKASRKVKKSVIGQDLQAHARGIWGLLPAFCRLPTDISQSFQSFAKLMLDRLENDASLHEDIVIALQELVKSNKCLPKSDDAADHIKDSFDLLIEEYLFEKRRLYLHSKKAVSRNIKALSLYSHELLEALMNVYIASPSEKRSILKKAIHCLSSVSDSSTTKKIFISSLERFPLMKDLLTSGECDMTNSSLNDKAWDSSSLSNDSQWCLVLDLASSVVEGADEDLVDLIFRLTKQALQAGDGIVVSEAYSTLSCILEEHTWFCSSKIEELVDLLTGLKSSPDVCSLSNRLSTLRLLLVHALKSNSDEESKKAFFILNEIIIALKDSNEEARKTAYDALLSISSSLAGSSSSNPGDPHYRLINMILGYLSGPSPHITSAAISALSMLVFKEPEICLIVSNLVSSVTSLLQTKAIEVIKAVLGFVKVLVSCMEPKDLQNFVSVIMDGVLPWSSVSRHHFRSKVTVILEILMRKCGFPAVKSATPERYQAFVKKVSLSRHGKTTSEQADSADAEPQLSNATNKGQNKRARNETQNGESGSILHRKKRRKQNQESHSHDTKSRTGDARGKVNKVKRGNFGQASGKQWKGDGTSGKNGNREGAFSKHGKRDRAFGKHGKRDGVLGKDGKRDGAFDKYGKRDDAFGKDSKRAGAFGRHGKRGGASSKHGKRGGASSKHGKRDAAKNNWKK